MSLAQVLTLEERATIFSIEDMLIDSLDEHKEAVQKGHGVRARELEVRIQGLRQRKKEPREMVDPATASRLDPLASTTMP